MGLIYFQGTQPQLLTFTFSFAPFAFSRATTSHCPVSSQYLPLQRPVSPSNIWRFFVAV